MIFKDGSYYFLFNKISGFFIKLEQDSYSQVLSIKNNPNRIDDFEEKELFVKNKILVKNNKKEIYIHKKNVKKKEILMIF